MDHNQVDVHVVKSLTSKKLSLPASFLDGRTLQRYSTYCDFITTRQYKTNHLDMQQALYILTVNMCNQIPCSQTSFKCRTTWLNRLK